MEKKFMWTVLFVLFVFLASSFADTIYMKDGSKVSGQITEEDSYKVTIKVGKFPRVFYRNTIDRIVKEGYGGTDSNPADADVAPVSAEEQKELVLRLLDANGMRGSLIIMVQQILADVPDESRDKFADILQINKMMDQIVPVYTKYYTAEDINVLISFYKSPTGIKHVELSPKVLEETMNTISEYFVEQSKEIEPVDEPAPIEELAPADEPAP